MLWELFHHKIDKCFAPAACFLLGDGNKPHALEKRLHSDAGFDKQTADWQLQGFSFDRPIKLTAHAAALIVFVAIKTADMTI